MNPSKFDKRKDTLTFFINEEGQQSIVTTYPADCLTGLLANVSEWQRDVVERHLKKDAPLTIWLHKGFVDMADEFITTPMELTESKSFWEVLPF